VAVAGNSSCTPNKRILAPASIENWLVEKLLRLEKTLMPPDNQTTKSLN